MMSSEEMTVGWEIKKLGEVCNISTGKLNANAAVENGKYPFFTCSREIFTIDHFAFDCEAILLAGNNAVGDFNVKHYKGKFNAYQRTYVITINKEETLLYKYLYLQVENALKDFKLKSVGAGTKFLKLDMIKNLKLHLPPLSEQKRIVAIADEAFEGIDRAIRNTEKNLSNARELFESYLNSKLLPIVSSNLTQTLSSVTDLIVDCEHKTAPTQETGIPSIRTPNIGKGYLIFDNVNRVSEEIYELWTRRAKPEPGDLILAREAPAGNVGVIPEGYKVCLGQRTVLIRPNKKSVDSQYLAFLLLHPLMQKRLLAKSTGATVQHVNMKDIRELAINELPPIQTQRDCIEDLKQLESQSNRLESIYRQKIAVLKELKQSILQKAFTGELTADKGEK
ncbi:MAG: restriction endonuclease subunit S [Dolichospermum sp.]|jgi:type I restriction enzyme, S subunit